MSSTPACPNCGVILEKTPTRTRKCPDCGEKIVIRTDRKTKEKFLLTEAQADQFDAQRAVEVARNKTIRHAEAIGLSEDDFRHAEAGLASDWGFDPSPGDVFWRLANQQTQVAMVSADWHQLSMIYLTMGLHLHDEGRDHTRLRHQSNDAKVRDYQATNTEYGIGHGVQALANACCDACRKLDGRVFSFEEALSSSPLPPDDCTRDWCNCGWNFAIDD